LRSSLVSIRSRRAYSTAEPRKFDKKGKPMRDNWTHNDIVVNGVRLHYTRTGNGEKPPLVLIHGFSDTGRLWTPVARDLEADYDIIMPDMRGHGLSARVQADEQVDMAADVAALIRVLDLDQPIVGGHSMGAMVTYQLGLRFPDLIKALFLEDPVWRLSWPEPALDAPRERPLAWVKDLPNKTLDDLLAEHRKAHPRWSDETVSWFSEAKTQLDLTIAEIVAGQIQSKEYNWLTTLPTLTQPLLLFTANPELGGIVTPEVTAKVRALNPTVTIAHVPDVGHHIRFDNYAAFMAALLSFLSQLSPV
jgi:pimeloyl-ACP methyl ester carboxylesterase